MGYALRSDKLGFRAVNTPSDCLEDETYSDDVPELATIPLEQTLGTISQYQFRKCLRDKGLTESVNKAIDAIEDEHTRLDIKDALSYVYFFERLDPKVVYMLSVLGLSTYEANELWQYALTL